MPMDLERKTELVLRAPTEEIVTRDELKELLEANSHPVHYIGFEISGKLHLGSLLMNGYKVNDLHEAGFKTQIFLADWHSVINNKMESSWEKIGKAAEYYEEAFKFFCPGAKILRGSELYEGNDEYWRDVITFSKQLTLARASRCLTILGRTEKDSLELAQYFYPSMQGVDIKHLNADLCHAGMDQRKIHMVAREVFPKMGLKKRLALHHHLLPGLTEPPKNIGKEKEERVVAAKMSKSLPSSAIFIHDSEEEIRGKVRKAYCPESVEGNPVLELAKYVIFREKKSLKVEREQKYGGDLEYQNYHELEEAFTARKLHAMDLKNAVGGELAGILKPIRKHFENKKELLSVFERTEITR